MKITEIKTLSISCPLEKPFELGLTPLTITNVGKTFIILYTSDGLVGVGEALNEAGASEISKLIDKLKPVILGESPYDVERIWHRMFQATTVSYPSNYTFTSVIAGVDTALWDIIGKSTSTSLYRLLGGFRDRIPVYASGGYYQEGKTNEELFQEMKGYARSGYKAVKMKVGRLSLEEDRERVKVVRDAVGDDIDIMCDCNRSYTPQQAIQFAKMIEEFNIYWLEEPVHWYDQLKGTKIVKEAVSMPVASGESERTRFGCRDLIEQGAVDIMQVDCREVGGITEWRKIAAMASMYHIQMAPHHTPYAHIHLMASTANGLILEVFPDEKRDPLWAELYVNRPQIIDGVLEVPDRPGLGLEFNQKTLEKYGIDWTLL